MSVYNDGFYAGLFQAYKMLRNKISWGAGAGMSKDCLSALQGESLRIGKYIEKYYRKSLKNGRRKI